MISTSSPSTFFTSASARMYTPSSRRAFTYTSLALTQRATLLGSVQGVVVQARMQVPLPSFK